MEIKNDLKPKAVIFDFDETLFFLDVAWEKMRKYLSEKFLKLGYKSNFKPVYADLENVLGKVEKDYGKIYTNKVRNECLDYIQEQELIGLKNGHANPQARSVLEKLGKSGVRYGIVSNNSKKVIKQALREFSWPEGEIIGREDVLEIKPSPEGTILCLKRMRLTADMVWGVGNRPEDVQSFTSAGISKILCICDLTSGKIVHLDALEELLKWIN